MGLVKKYILKLKLFYIWEAIRNTDSNDNNFLNNTKISYRDSVMNIKPKYNRLKHEKYNFEIKEGIGEENDLKQLIRK